MRVTEWPLLLCEDCGAEELPLVTRAQRTQRMTAEKVAKPVPILLPRGMPRSKVTRSCATIRRIENTVTASNARNQSPLNASGARFGMLGSLFFNQGAIQRFSAVNRTSKDATSQIIDITLPREPACNVESWLIQRPPACRLTLV